MDKNDNLIIGEFGEYEDTRLISFGTLKKIKWFHTIDQYTNLIRFKYDPFTGEKIDWEKLKEDYDSKIF